MQMRGGQPAPSWPIRVKPKVILGGSGSLDQDIAFAFGNVLVSRSN